LLFVFSCIHTASTVLDTLSLHDALPILARDFAAGLEVDEVQRLADLDVVFRLEVERAGRADTADLATLVLGRADRGIGVGEVGRSEEHTSELQSRVDLVCRLLLEKKKRE